MINLYSNNAMRQFNPHLIDSVNNTSEDKIKRLIPAKT